MAICFFVFLFLVLFFTGLGAEHQDKCRETRCGDDEPAIRFPFWLKDRQPESCGSGLPGFNLSCTTDNDTVLELPLSVEGYVRKIDYKSQLIHIWSQRDYCFRKPQLSAFLPFQLKEMYSSSRFTFFNCTSSPERSLVMITCPGGQLPAGYKVYAVRSDDSVFDLVNYLVSCRKMYNNFSVAYQVIDQGYDQQFYWSKKDESQGAGAGAGKKLKVTGVILGVSLVALVVIALYRVHRSKKLKKEDEVKIEKFLEDYKALKPSRYSYADINKITNQFKDKLGQGGYGTVFKGKLSNEIYVAVKVLGNNNFKGNGEEFINEVGTIGKIHHVNVVRLVGYCADGFRRALVYEFLPNDSLEKFISSGNHKNHSLGWEALQDIALGIAKGIEYLHQGCDQRILHFDIKPRNILLDHNLNPKIADFGLAKLCAKEQSVVSMTTTRGTMGYIAPEVFSRNFGNVSYKADVYSFGMLLLEMVGGKKNIDVRAQSTSQAYFPEWVYNRLNQGEELGIQIEEEEDTIIAKKLTTVGLWCIQWYPVDRPSMKIAVQMLERDGDTLTMPPNPFGSTIPTKTNVANHSRALTVISEIEGEN